MVKTLLRRKKGRKTQQRISKIKQASHSKWPTASPEDAPVPDSPMKCSVELLETNKAAPMKNHPISRPATKQSSEVRSFHAKSIPTPKPIATLPPPLTTPTAPR